jgi:uncharacterized protein YdhG (YjbR/CyaY superfamily)
VAKTAFKSVDEYLASQPPAVRRTLTRVRNTIRKAVPGADETISYGIPAYKLQGRTVLYFAGWTEHYSVYPYGDRIAAAFGDELEKYKVSKGTIRFPLAEPVPVTLIEGIAKLRAAEVAERAKPKAASRKQKGAARRR